MRMVRLLELVLDQDRGVASNIGTKQIGGEEADSDFLLNLDIDLKPKRPTEQMNVLPQPRREFVRLALPDLPRVEALERTELRPHFGARLAQLRHLCCW